MNHMISKAKLLSHRINVLHHHLYLCEGYSGPKWARSTWQPSSIHFRHGTKVLFIFRWSKNWQKMKNTLGSMAILDL